MRRYAAYILISVWIGLPVWAGTWAINFDDAHDDGATRWGANLPQPIGKWTFSQGAYLIEASGGHWAGSFWGDASWTDYTVEVRARSTVGVGCIAITVRAQDALNYYLWAFDVKGNRLAWLRGINGDFIHRTVDPAPGDPLAAHVLKVVVSGDGLEGYFDGALIRRWQDELYPSGSTGIGVGCGEGTAAVFDNLTIVGEAVQDRRPVNLDARAVGPSHKLATTWGAVKHTR